jgi:phage gp29-like protein
MVELARVPTPKAITDEIATAAKDIDIFAGWLNRLENPDPVLRTEASGKGLKLYDEVERDAHAGSVLQDRTLALVGKEWEIVPGTSARTAGRPASTTREERIADFVAEVLQDCNFDQARGELLKAILYGFYAAEIMWRLDKGAVRIDRILGKHPRRFSFTVDRELRLLTPQNLMEGEHVPDRKFIIFTYGESDNPYGKGLGQKIWWPVWFKKNGIKFWMVFLEKYGMPTALGKYPPGTDKEQQDKLLDAIDAIQNETGIKVPNDMGIELLEASRRSTATYEELCDYMDRQISKAVIGQTASTEGTPGKLGAEKERAEVRQDIIEADADLLDSCLNQGLIKWIVDYNFPAVTDYPRIKTHAEPKPDLAGRSEIDERLSSKIGLPMPRRYFYETYNVPEPEEGEEIVEAPARGGMFAETKSARYTPEQEKVEGLVGAGVDRARAMSGLQEPIRNLIRDAKNLEEIRDGLYALYPDTDSKAMQELIAQSLFAAELYGRATAQERMQAAEKRETRNE